MARFNRIAGLLASTMLTASASAKAFALARCRRGLCALKPTKSMLPLSRPPLASPAAADIDCTEVSREFSRGMLSLLFRSAVRINAERSRHCRLPRARRKRRAYRSRALAAIDAHSHAPAMHP